MNEGLNHRWTRSWIWAGCHYFLLFQHQQSLLRLFYNTSSSRVQVWTLNMEVLRVEESLASFLCFIIKRRESFMPHPHPWDLLHMDVRRSKCQSRKGMLLFWRSSSFRPWTFHSSFSFWVRGGGLETVLLEVGGAAPRRKKQKACGHWDFLTCPPHQGTRNHTPS